MNLAVVALSLWERKASTVLDIAWQMARVTEPGAVVLLDRAGIERYTPRGMTVPHSVYVVRNWIDGYILQRAEIDASAVRLQCDQICTADGVQVLDAAHLDLEVLSRAVWQMRLAMYHQSRWPDTLLFVVDDFLVHQAIETLARTFFIQPAVHGKNTTNEIIRKLYLRFALSRFMGRQVERYEHLLRRLLHGPMPRGPQEEL